MKYSLFAHTQANETPNQDIIKIHKHAKNENEKNIIWLWTARLSGLLDI